jgi:hypothetical protein
VSKVIQMNCPNDGVKLLPATLRQVRLVVQLQQEAGFFTHAGSSLQIYTCPQCGLTHLYAAPPLASETVGTGSL